jgi:DNA-directed RNA polymerase specialized sigma24 family protein/CheY-like chemotaxis protein
MSEGDGLVAYVPYLRRFARALTGSQVTGDACVVAGLEAILGAKSPDVAARLSLYRSVITAVNAREARPMVDANPAAEVAPADRNLAALTPRGRQAFLLVAMEGFTLQEAAEVMEISPTDVSLLIEEATQDITAQIATNVVIIEDEPLIALDLQHVVQGLGHRVVGVARTERQAIAAVMQTRPGLVLADIRLADGSSGVHAVNEILKTFSVPVVFITAFPETLLTGKKPEPTFLIRKPYNPDEVKAVISQALFFDVRP